MRDGSYPKIEGYEILEPLGVGGMGTVYRAIELEFDRQVALKLIHDHLARDPSFDERFRSEMRIAISLQHPNIVPVFSAGESDRKHYIAMMLVPGEDLATLIDKNGPLEASEAVSMVRQIASALDEVHARRLIHRDLKPQNVIVDERNSQAYLTDFGLARSLDGSTIGLTATGQQIGTIEYMSPEQIDDHKLSHKTDVYSLGCLLYSLVSGRAPFEGSTATAVIRQKMDGPSSPTLEELGFSPTLSRIIERAQSDDPDDRYESAGQLARAAQSTIGGDPAGSTQQASRRTRPLPRRRDDMRHRETVKLPDQKSKKSTGRLIAGGILGLVGVLGAVAAVMAFAGGGGGEAQPNRDEESGEPVVRATTTVTEAATTTGPDGSAPVRTGDRQKLTLFTGDHFQAEVPKGWRPELIDEETSGRFTSQWRDPDDPNTSVLIDYQQATGPSAMHSASSVRRQTSQTPGYEEIEFGPTTINDYAAAEWVFDVSGDRRIDYFVDICDQGLAILGSTSPERFDEMRPTFQRVAESAFPYCD